MPDTLLKLTDVTKSYPASESERIEVLRGISLTVSAGDALSIIGPSGSGKSTLLNILGLLDTPTAGTVELGGKDVSTLAEAHLSGIRNSEIGFIFQAHHLLPQCNILENVLVPTLVHHDNDGAEARARRLLERVGLSDRLMHRPSQLSGGERQRVAVVRALINEPRLLLADEPTGSLDQDGATTLCDLLVELNREEGVTVLMVTHALALARKMELVMELQGGTLHPTQQ